MTVVVTPDASSLVTLVVRAWVASPPEQPRELRFQTTHIQTGQVSYFGSLEAVAQYVQRLSDALVAKSTRQPIDFSNWRRA